MSSHSTNVIRKVSFLNNIPKIKNLSFSINSTLNKKISQIRKKEKDLDKILSIKICPTISPKQPHKHTTTIKKKI